MTDAQHEQDLEAIRHLITQQFASVTWTEEREADWSAFAADFLADAPLFPASRPVEARSVPNFLTRMKAPPARDLRLSSSPSAAPKSCCSAISPSPSAFARI